MASPHHVRLFLSSPGDVSAERKIALNIIDQMHYDPYFRGKILIEVVAWDKVGADTPMLATMTPQEAINQGLPKPSACDIVVVIFWTRMGTPLPTEYIKPPQYQFSDPGAMEAERYLSGTEWEFVDALEGALDDGLPMIVVYQRTEKVLLDDEAGDFEERLLQKRRVRAFFDSFTNVDGSIRQGFNLYDQPEDFRQKFDVHMRKLLMKLLETPDQLRSNIKSSAEAEKPLWEGSPFPGLRAFTPKDAPIFFGRGRETNALVQKLQSSAVVAVVGASGAGKSSLVNAGLIPQLETNAVPGGKDWKVVSFRPGGVRADNPFQTLAAILITQFYEENIPFDELIERRTKLAEQLINTPDVLVEMSHYLLRKSPSWAKVLFIIDQFEELFTVVGDYHRAQFIELLDRLAKADRICVLVTIRADFYHHCLAYPTLTRLLDAGAFPLARPDHFALLEMIERPAERAGLRLEDGLARQIVQDAGSEPGALALMAYALDELYQKYKSEKVLTLAGYEALGGVQGAIGKRAEDVFQSIPEHENEGHRMMTGVFRHLVTISDIGTATRRRAAYSALEDRYRLFVDGLLAARLLVTDLKEGESTLEIAHEALFQSWPRLRQWITDTTEDLQLWKEVVTDAYKWNATDRSESDRLWSMARLVQVYQMQKRLEVEFDHVVSEFIRPETDRVLEAISSASKDYQQHSLIDRLAAIGSIAVPALWQARTMVMVAVREHVEDVLTQYEQATLQHVRECLLNHPDPNQRALAALYLGKKQDEDGLLALSAAMGHEAFFVRAAALCALIEYAPSLQFMDFVFPLNDPDEDVRALAVEVTAKHHREIALPALIEKLSDPSTRVRQASVNGLRKLKAQGAIQALFHLLEDTDADTLLLAFETLEELGQHAAIRARFQTEPSIDIAPILGLINAEDRKSALRTIRVLAKLGDQRVIAPALGLILLRWETDLDWLPNSAQERDVKLTQDVLSALKDFENSPLRQLHVSLAELDQDACEAILNILQKKGNYRWLEIALATVGFVEAELIARLKEVMESHQELLETQLWSLRSLQELGNSASFYGLEDYQLENRVIYQTEIGQRAAFKAYSQRAGKSVLVRLSALPEEIHIRNGLIHGFQRETAVLHGLNHPRIPKLVEYRQTDKLWILVLDYVPGMSLYQKSLELASPMEEGVLLSVALQLCEMLVYLHSQGIIHRDIKPENIIMTDSGDVYLIDYGIAKPYEPGQKGTMIGTEGYAAPEQYRGLAAPPSDVYALGATLHHLATHTDPRLEPPFTQAERPIRNFNPTISLAFDTIIMRALAFSLDGRYTSAQEMLDDLEALA